MTSGWEKFDASPIEVFHGEVLAAFHKKASNGLINGGQFNDLIAEFKRKIMKEYGISGAVKSWETTSQKLFTAPTVDFIATSGS